MPPVRYPPAARGPRLRDIGVMAAVAALALAWFVAVATTRLIDADEGYYLLAARLVVDGRLPYAGFFFPQMFLTPYVYGVWTALLGTSWHVARILSALLAAGLATLVYGATVAALRRRGLAVLAVALLLFGELSLGWLTTTKTYALSALLLFAAYVLAQRSRLGRAHAFSLGVLLGLAVDARLYVAGVLPIFLIHVWRRSREETADRPLGAVLAGLIFALLPNLALLAADPGAFVFDNLGYHALRSAGGLIGDPGQKLAVLLDLLGRGGTSGALQLAAVFVPSLLYCLVILAGRGPARLSVTLELTLVGLLLLPTPTYLQYYSLVLPFAVLNTALSIDAAERRLAAIAPRAVRPLWGIVALGGGLYASAAPGLLARYTVTGDGVIGVWSARDAPDWEIATVKAVSLAMNKAAPGHGVALASWPGYLFESDLEPLPGSENQFAPPVAPLLPAGEAHRRRLASRAEMIRAIDEGVPDVVVLGNWMTPAERLRARDHLDHSPYRLFARVGNAEVWTRRGAATGVRQRP